MRCIITIQRPSHYLAKPVRVNPPRSLLQTCSSGIWKPSWHFVQLIFHALMFCAFMQMIFRAFMQLIFRAVIFCIFEQLIFCAFVQLQWFMTRAAALCPRLITREASLHSWFVHSLQCTSVLSCTLHCTCTSIALMSHHTGGVITFWIALQWA